MNLPHWALHLPSIYGQLLLAVLMLLASFFSHWEKKRREKRDEDREEKRKLEDEAREEARNIEMAAYRAEEEARQEELARNLKISQELVETHARLLKKDLEEVKRELQVNTQVNVEALATANGFNEKIAAVVDLVAAAPTAVQQVEIVQDHPVLVQTVEEYDK